MTNSNPWDVRYSAGEYYYGTEPNEFLKANTGLIQPAGDVLCLAEGEGRNAVYLAQLGFRVTAVDGSAVGLSKMDQLAASKKVSITSIISDLAAFSIEATKWDCIVSIWCHLPKALRKQVHQAAVGGLRPGGLMILEAYQPRQLEFKTGGPSDVEMLMALNDLREEFSGLELTLAQEIERDVHEGKGHFGKSAVVQVIARKPN
jgi:SAM-dependent methyltransferase